MKLVQRPLGGERIICDAVDLELAGVRVGEAVADMAVGVDLPVGAGLGQLLPERDDLVGRDHRIVPAVEGDDLGPDLFGRQPGRVEQAVEADGRGDVRAAAREVERALPAEAIAGDNNLLRLDFIKPAHLLEHLRPGRRRSAARSERSRVISANMVSRGGRGTACRTGRRPGHCSQARPVSGRSRSRGR